MNVHRNGMKRFVFAARPAIGSGKANAKSIRSDLETILYDDFDIDGSFSFNKAYPDSPNPGLGLADLGLVGLPLGVREEELVKARCQPPISKDNTTCRVPRYMAARKVTFNNAMWPRFLARVSRDVCEGLGALYPKGHPPTLELRKLLLCEPGLQILLPTERRSQSEQKRVFAHVIIFLPSNFTGGSACFKLPRSGFSITQQCGVNNPYETNVLAWHADVNYDIQPITSGTRLALCFDIMHNAPSPRPGLSVDEELIFRLRSVFAAWRRDEGRSAPSKLIYLLGETKYVSSRKGLDGSDVLKVDILSMIAEEEGIHLGLANVEYRQAGPGAREDGDYYFTDRREVETSLSVTDFVNPDGKAISPKLKVGYNETIPLELRDAIIDDEECDDEEFESDYDERHSSLVRTWDRSVLVMWPVWSNL